MSCAPGAFGSYWKEPVIGARRICGDVSKFEMRWLDVDEALWTQGVAGGRRGEAVNLVDGTTFVVSGRSGVIGENATQGLYMLDTRVVSSWRLGIDGWKVEPLEFVPGGPFSGTFVSQAERANQPDSPIAVIQRRYVGRGMREDVEIRNHGPASELMLRLNVASDLAGLFEVKAGQSIGGVRVPAVAESSGMRFEDGPGAASASAVDAVIVRSSTPPDESDGSTGCMTWVVVLPSGGSWSTCIQVSAIAAGLEIEPTHGCGGPVEDAIPAGRFRHWRESTPKLRSGHQGLDRTVVRALDDLGSLRIFDPDHVERVVVAAGAPWFMALFGRDSLLASWMALPFDQGLAQGVLLELADKQGVGTDVRTEEQPGRILHEVRLDRLSERLLGGSSTYFGTVDATPLFVMLTAELARWTGITEHIIGLMPAVDRAIEWIESLGDRDGDGFVEYLRSHPSGLENQGWKDSWDGIRHDDGSVAVAPIALCEVQGYVYAAYRSRAWLARALGEASAVADDFDERADAIQRRFDETFWLDDVGWYAIGLDESKRPIRSLTSNIGHLLWCGIVPEARASAVAAHLMSPAMFSGWGLRTLASNSPGYNPLSYHCGSVWPHDSAIAVAGLSRYGFDDEAQALADALIEAAIASDGRLPELFGGFARDDIPSPVPYPTSCSPQAWASAAPLLLVRSLLGLEPDVPSGRLTIRPHIGPSVGLLRLTGIRIGNDRVDITAYGRSADVTGTQLELAIS